MTEAGIVGPNKSNIVLQNAASVSALLRLTTEAAVADKPAPVVPPRQDGSGMGMM